MKTSKLCQMREELYTLFGDVRKDRRMCPQAHEAANVAGKILNSLKVEMEYSALRKETPEIEFITGESIK